MQCNAQQKENLEVVILIYPPFFFFTLPRAQRSRYECLHDEAEQRYDTAEERAGKLVPGSTYGPREAAELSRGRWSASGLYFSGALLRVWLRFVKKINFLRSEYLNFSFFFLVFFILTLI